MRWGPSDLLNLLVIVWVILLALRHIKVLSLRSELLALSAVLLSTGDESLFLSRGWFGARGDWLSGSVYRVIFTAPLLIGLVLQNKYFASSEALGEMSDGVLQPFALLDLRTIYLAQFIFVQFGGDSELTSAETLSQQWFGALVATHPERILFSVRTGPSAATRRRAE